MLKNGLFGAVITGVVMTLGVSLLVTEPSEVKWLGLLIIFGGLVVAAHSWAALSFYAEDRSGQQPRWHILRVLERRDH